MQVQNECKVTEIFCIIDDFCKEFSKIESKTSILDGKSHRNKPNRLSAYFSWFNNSSTFVHTPAKRRYL